MVRNVLFGRRYLRKSLMRQALSVQKQSQNPFELECGNLSGALWHLLEAKTQGR